MKYNKLRTLFLALMCLFVQQVEAQLVPDFEITDITNTVVTQGCAPFVVFYSDSSTFNGSPVTYASIATGGSFNSHTWYSGNLNGTSNLLKPSFAYPAPGTYNIKLVITQDGINYDSIVRQLVVNPEPVVGFTADIVNGCNPLTVTFTDTSSGNTRWIWDTGDGRLDTNSSFTHTYVVGSGGQRCFTVTLIAQNAFGCSRSLTKTNYVCIDLPPVADFYADTVLLCDTPFVVQFFDSSTSVNPLRYAWNLAGAAPPTSTQQNPVATYPPTTGTYNVRLTVTDTICGTTATRLRTAYIRTSNVDLSFTADEDTICAGNTVNFTSSITGSYTGIQWDFGPPGATSTALNPSYTYTTPGLWSVRLRVFNATGCVNDTTITDMILVRPQPTVSFTPSATVSCQAPFTVTFTPQVSPGVTSYQWFFNSPNATPAFTSSQQTPTFTYNNPGTYSVRLVVTDGNGCTATVTQNSLIQIAPTTVNFSMDTSEGCAPLTVDFTDNSTSNDPIINRTWDFGDGSPNTTGSTVSHVYAITGVYNACLTIVTQTGCTGTRCFDVRVGTPASANFSFTPNPACTDAQVSFTNLSTGFINEWAWTFDGAGADGTANPPDQVWEEPGTYTVSLEVGNNGCKSDTSFQIDIVGVNAEWTSTVSCFDIGAVQFTNTTVGGDVFEWQFGDGNTSNQLNPLHTYAMSGNYEVTLTVTDNLSGCVSEQIDSVRASVLNADFGANRTSGCAPLSVAFPNLSTGNSLAYRWTFGDGSTLFSTVPVYTYTTPGTYTVTLVVTDINGCTDTLIRPNYIYVSDVTANFTGSPRQVCIPSDSSAGSPPINFTNQAVNNGAAPLTYNWDFGDGDTSTLESPSHVYTSPGLYPITQIVTNGDGCRDTLRRPSYIDVNQPQAEYDLGFNVFCASQLITFNNTSTGDGLRYRWDFGDPSTNADTSILTNPSYTFQDTGTYDVRLWVVDALGCRDSLIGIDAINIAIPDLQFLADDTFRFCPPHVVNFSNFANFDTVAVDSVVWDFGDGSGSTNLNPSHIYNRAGLFTVCLEVYFANGCADSLCYPNYVNIGGVVGDIEVWPDSGCGPLEVCMTANASAAAGQFWFFGDGSDTLALDTVCHIYEVAGLYVPTVLLLDTQVPNCQYLLPYGDTLVVDSVLANFWFDADTACQNEAVLFTDSSRTLGNKPIVAWDWDFDGVDTDTVQNPTYRFQSSSGLVTVTLTVTSSFGCTSTVSRTLFVQSSPFADMNVSDSIGCDELQVLFTDASSNGDTTISAWFWDFGVLPLTNDTANVPNPPPYFYDTIGIYNTFLAVTDGNGCLDTAFQTIWVYPTPNGISGPDTVEICLNDSILLLGDTSYAIYDWTPGTGLTDSTVAQPFASPTVNTLYTLLTIDTTGCETLDSVFVMVNPLPQLSVSPYPDTAICEGDNIQLNATSNGIGLVWVPGSGLSDSNAASPIASPAVTTTYQVFTVDGKGCTEEDTIRVIVNRFQTDFVPSRVCLGAPTAIINFSQASDLPITSYQWFFGDPSLPDGGTASTRNATHLYADSGTYTVMLVVEDINGCTDTLTKLAVVDYPLEVDAITDTIICKGATANLAAFGGDSVVWTPVDGLSETVGFTTTATPDFTTTYVASIKNGVCPTDTAQVTVTVQPQPSVTTIDDATILKGSGIELNTIISEYDTLYWLASDSLLLFCDSCESPLVELEITTAFVITAIDSLGCVSSDTVTINVIEKCDEDQIFVGNGFTPNGDGRNDRAYARLIGLKQLNHFKIFDRWGALVFETSDETEGWDGKNTSGEQLNSGVYVYMVEAECFSGQKLTRTGNVTLIK